jgi:hypothetical protein
VRCILVPPLLCALACQVRHEPQPRDATRVGPTRLDQLTRADFNRLAVRENVPIFWVADKNLDNAVQPDEVVPLLFYPGPAVALADAYPRLVAAAKAPTPSDPRIALVQRDLDAGRPSLVLTDLSHASKPELELATRMLNVAQRIDHIYAIQNGAAALVAKVPHDPASQSLFRRNRGPRCVGAATEKEPMCTAIPGAPRPIVDVYPPSLQTSDGFCKELEARPDAKALLAPFTAVRERDGKLVAVPYSEAYREDATEIAAQLNAAADAMKDAREQALVDYLRAAANSFLGNDWLPADEAWAKMSVDNSSWFVRVGPDEVYWEPCSHKAGFHLTFARIDQGSKDWQRKLVPVQQDMEQAIAARAGAPYEARKVTFHLPDFIDIVLNAGDDRAPLGATIGQSLPNWGPVANEGRGRTIAMVNLYADPDSLAARHAQAASMLDAATMRQYADSSEPGRLTTILHEATHNLGPAHEYRVRDKVDAELFGGPVASMLEELKAQTGALFLIELLRGKGLVSDELARQTYTDAIVWAFGHVSQGMYTGAGQRKTYGNVAAIQLGFLIDHGVLTWNAATAAANQSDRGAFTLRLDKMSATADELMKLVAGIKARGDKKAAQVLIDKYVDTDTVVPHAKIAERFLRVPKASFVYSIEPPLHAEVLPAGRGSPPSIEPPPHSEVLPSGRGSAPSNFR